MVMIDDGRCSATTGGERRWRRKNAVQKIRTNATGQHGFTYGRQDDRADVLCFVKVPPKFSGFKGRSLVVSSSGVDLEF